MWWMIKVETNSDIAQWCCIDKLLISHASACRLGVSITVCIQVCSVGVWRNGTRRVLNNECSASVGRAVVGCRPESDCRVSTYSSRGGGWRGLEEVKRDGTRIVKETPSLNTGTFPATSQISGAAIPLKVLCWCRCEELIYVALLCNFPNYLYFSHFTTLTMPHCI